MDKFSAEDHSALLRLASSLPVGDENRRAILSGLKKADEAATFAKEVTKTLKDYIKRIRDSDEMTEWLEENDYKSYEPDDAFGPQNDAWLAKVFKEGWSTRDAVAYLKNTEEVDPRIPENEALSNMKAIEKKYKK